MGWGLDGCARLRKVTITNNKIELGSNFQMNLMSCGTKQLGLDGGAVAQCYNYSYNTLNWKVIVKGIIRVC